MSGVGDRIRLFADYQKLTIQQFERYAGLSNGAVSKMSDNPRAATVRNIIEGFPEINKAWLISGKGDMLNPNVRPVDRTEDKYNYKNENVETRLKEQDEIIARLATQNELLLSKMDSLSTLVNELAVGSMRQTNKLDDIVAVLKQKQQ